MIGSHEACQRKAASAIRRASETSPWHGDLSLASGGLELLQGLVDGMRCGIVAIDRHERLMMINRVALQILELEEFPETGSPVGRALRDHPRVAQVLCESFDMASLPNRAELDLHAGEPNSKTIGFTLSMIPDPNGGTLGSAIFFKDLTQIEHKEEQERLKDRLAALGEMAANMAHEIRNPLASIGVSCKLLQRRLDALDTGGDDSRQLLSNITTEVRRLNRTITSSLEFVRPLSLRTEHGDLCAILDEAISVAGERAAKPDVRFERQYASGIEPFLMDRGQLRQVFENLILNAMEAIDDDGVVTVEVETRPAPSATSIPYPMGEERVRDPWHHFEQFAIVRIADTGPGISEEERDRIFYPFFTTKKQGSGVGLSVAKKIVTSHRGLIDLDSAPGGGAMFTVRLPMVLEEAEV